jgi:hypothetical protein
LTLKILDGRRERRNVHAHLLEIFRFPDVNGGPVDSRKRPLAGHGSKSCYRGKRKAGVA